MITKSIQTKRNGFTIVELLVATALTMLIMAIMAAAFQSAMDSLSHLRSTGELQDRLRTATEIMKLDLRSPHFEDSSIKNNLLSNIPVSVIPQSGFVRIEQENESLNEFPTINVKEYSTTARGPVLTAPITRNESHRLMMTVKLKGDHPKAVFTAQRVAGLDNKYDDLVQNPASTYASKWAVVSWFLYPSGEYTQGPSPQPLFNLHRKVRIISDMEGVTLAADSDLYLTYPTAAVPTTYRVYTPKELASVATRSYAFSSLDDRAGDYRIPVVMGGLNKGMFDPADDGSDIVLSNILSFELKADYTPVIVPLPVAITWPRDPAASINNFDYPFDSLPNNAKAAATRPYRLYDSGAGGFHYLDHSALPLTYFNVTTTVRGIQVKIRIYDPKNKTTRQSTIVQEM